MLKLKKIWPKSTTLRAAIITGILGIIAAIIRSTWIFPEGKDNNITLNINVLDSITNQRIEGAKVSIDLLGITGTTNQNGLFNFSVPKKQLNLVVYVAKAGYKDSTLTISTNLNYNIEIFLRNIIEEYDEINIGPS